MKRILLALFIVASIAINATAQVKPIYKIYDKNGKEVAYNKMIKKLAKDDVVFFGEMHNCPITHWLELQVAEDLYAKHKANFVLGAEMFEHDNQLIMDEYMKGLISSERFEKEARLWGNYSTDYSPLIDFAQENNVQFVATNVPRRYARRVKEHGLESLKDVSAEAKRHIAPLPIHFEVDSSQISFFAMMGNMGRKRSKVNPVWMSQAQAIKDATMAWFIAENTKNKKMLHFNGSYHSDKYSGIINYLKRYNKKLKIGTISSARQEDINSLGEESIDRADYIIVVRQDMVTSY